VHDTYLQRIDHSINWLIVLLSFDKRKYLSIECVRVCGVDVRLHGKVHGAERLRESGAVRQVLLVLVLRRGRATVSVGLSVCMSLR